MPCWHLALYDDFAWFYNRYWNEEFHGLAFPILERIWLPRVARKGRILDVCCGTDRKSTRLNSSHRCISYAVFCLKKKEHDLVANPHNGNEDPDRGTDGAHRHR